MNSWADEFLMAMTLHVLADDGAVEHVEGGEQRGGSVALVVMGHGSEPTPLHRQAGLGAVERLDLALLVNRQHDGMGRRIDIETDDVAQLVDELRIVGELELSPAVRCEAVRLPDAAHRAGADAGGTCHGVRRPVRRLARRVGQRQRHHALGHIRPEWGDARGARLVTQQAINAFFGEARLPAPHAGLGRACLPHDLDGADTVGAQQDDTGTPDVFLRAVAVGGYRHEPGAIRRRYGERYSGAHATDSHTLKPMGIPARILVSGGYH